MFTNKLFNLIWYIYMNVILITQFNFYLKFLLSLYINDISYRSFQAYDTMSKLESFNLSVQWNY